MPEEMVKVCPHCDEAGGWYERAGRGNASAGDPSKPYHCSFCQQSFDQVKKRPAKPNHVPKPNAGPSAFTEDELNAVRRKLGIEVVEDG